MLMTNRELYKKILYELGNKYMIGLHESTKFTYKFRRNFDDIYYINDSLINEDNIMLNILKKGLCVPNRLVGLRSTVTFLDKINCDSFNYSYYQYLGNDKVYVLVIAIPNNIEIDGNRYNIRNMIDNLDTISYPLFNILLPREFIYGYYIKSVKYVEKLIDKDDVCYEFIADDNLDFYLNANFYGYMDNDSQRDFWINYFKDNNIDLCFNIGKKRLRKY